MKRKKVQRNRRRLKAGIVLAGALLRLSPGFAACNSPFDRSILEKIGSSQQTVSRPKR